MHLVWMPPVEIGAIGAEGRNFKLEAVFQHHDHTEMRAHRVSAGKDFLHILRPRVGRDIDILRDLPPDEVAHATAGKVGDMTRGSQPLNDAARRGFRRRKFVGAHNCAHLRAGTLAPRESAVETASEAAAGFYCVRGTIITETNCTAAAPHESGTVTRTATVPGVVLAVVMA